MVTICVFVFANIRKVLFKKQYFSNINFQGRFKALIIKRIIVAAIDNDYGLAVSD